MGLLFSGSRQVFLACPPFPKNIAVKDFQNAKLNRFFGFFCFFF
jgi:hypothetical protein